MLLDLSDPVTYLGSDSVGAGFRNIIWSIKTTLAAAVEILRFPVEENTTYLLDFKAVANGDANGHGYFQVRQPLYRESAGALVLDGPYLTVLAKRTGMGGASGIVVAADGNDLVVSIASDEANPFEWRGEYQLILAPPVTA